MWENLAGTSDGMLEDRQGHLEVCVADFLEGSWKGFQDALVV